METKTIKEAQEKHLMKIELKKEIKETNEIFLSH